MHIGIHLGITYCCVAFYNRIVGRLGEERGYQFCLIPSGSFSTTPSFVTIKNEGTMIFGRESKNRQSVNPNNTIFEIPRLIGRRFSDPEIQENIRARSNGTSRWPFKVKTDGTREDRAVVCVEINGKERVFTPEEICGCLLKHLVYNAENFLGESVDELTITCPAYFNEFQREATLKAAEFLGLPTVRLVCDPIAAVLAYKHNDINHSMSNRILVFDFSEFLDVSIVSCESNYLSTLASIPADRSLCQTLFTDTVVHYCLDKFRQFCPQFTINSVSERKMSLLKREVETAKEDLSINHSVEITVDDFYNGEDFEITLTRTELEAKCSFLFTKCITTVERVMEAANVRDYQIDAVLLVGGSSRIPKIRELMERKFGRKVFSTIQDDHAIAFGACVAHLYPVRPCIVKQIVVISDNSTSSDIRIVQLEAELKRVYGLLESVNEEVEQLRSENRRLQAIELENQSLKTQLKQFSSMSHRNPEPTSRKPPRIFRGDSKSNQNTQLTQQSGCSSTTKQSDASSTSNIKVERLMSLFNK
ncbi:hypothetical protein RCL1_005368 [Eukaryota sp. TZLM3-RCL]